MYSYVESREIGDSVSKRRVEFIHTELDLAKSFVDLAQKTQNAALRARSLNNAHRARASVVYFLEQGLGEGEMHRSEIEGCLLSLEHKLVETEVRSRMR